MIPVDEALIGEVEKYVDSRVAAQLAPVLSRIEALERGTSPAPAPSPLPGSPSPRALRMGMNLVSPTYYEPSWAFLDLMAGSQVNGTKLGDLSWQGPPDVALDMDGWPHSLASGQSVTTVLARVDGHYPGGEYDLAWEGTGTVALSGDAVGTFDKPTRVLVKPTTAGILLKITRSDALAPVRRVTFRPAGSVGTFHPKFLEALAPYSVLRFMDWGRTNNSEQVNWADRPKVSWRSQHRGVAYEHMIALANQAGADPWVCIPHKATPEYVKAMAALFKSQLESDRRVYVEYSNECWNGAFSQTPWLEAVSGVENVLQSYARLAAAHFVTWAEAWGAGSRERVVRVLSGQAANPDVGRQILAAAGAGACDALAVAPYLGGSVGRNAALPTLSVEQILDAVEADLPVTRDRMLRSRVVAEQFGVALLAYEGGQHLAAVGALADDPAVVSKLTEANRHERMGAFYRTYFEHWRGAGAGLFCHFDDVYAPRKTGAWGMLEYQDQPPTPKSRAVSETAAAWEH